MMRVQKYLSEQGILSRREAERYLVQGLIKINGVVVKELGTQIDPLKDKVEVLKAKGAGKKNITIAYYKPRGISSMKNDEGGETILDIIPDEFKGLNPVGRLDKESEGLILLSNDGVVTAVVTGEKHEVEKEYEVVVREDIKPRYIRKFEEGIMLEDGMTLPAKAEMLDPNSFNIILKEGRRHQIRRMAAKLNLTILRLKRVRVGSIKLGSIGEGKYRVLPEAEVEKLKKL